MEPVELEQELERVERLLSPKAKEAFDLYKKGKTTLAVSQETYISAGDLYNTYNPEIVAACKAIGWKVKNIPDVKRILEARQREARRRTPDQDKPATQPEQVRKKLPWKWLLGIFIIGVFLFVGWVLGSIFPWSVVQIPASTPTSTVTSIISAIVPVTETPTINFTATFTQFPAVSPTFNPDNYSNKHAY